nr:hypothetical protein [Nitrosomonas nitrosa]
MRVVQELGHPVAQVAGDLGSADHLPLPVARKLRISDECAVSLEEGTAAGRIPGPHPPGGAG